MKAILILVILNITNWAFSLEEEEPSRFKMVEICDNAIDDDGDGAIDLNDEDCDCPSASPKSLIPNPSFEEQDCCPGNKSQLYCASKWMQASFPTTDYMHTCGWMGWELFTVPMPIPDGEGFIGFRNGQPGENATGPRPYWKEYAGACLTSPLKVGKRYKIEFYIGFSNANYSPPLNVSFYGASSCDDIPFNMTDADFGCPLNEPGWIELGKVLVTGINSWQKAEINFSPSKELHSIVIGPNCEAKPSLVPYYYFFDNLVLADEEDFDFNIKLTGNPCLGTGQLAIPVFDTLRYQWYKNGVALLGETAPQLKAHPEDGVYQVRLLGPSSCSLSEAYFYRTPIDFTVEEKHICQGSNYPFNDQFLKEDGIYWDTLKSQANCDSIVQLYLTVDTPSVETIQAKIFESETYKIGEQQFNNPGQYTLSYQSKSNCDSIINLELDFYEVYFPNAFSPNGDGINDLFTLHTGPEVKSITTFHIMDRWGNLVYSNRQIDQPTMTDGWDGTTAGKAMPPGVYIYQTTLLFDDEQERSFSGSVTLLR